MDIEEFREEKKEEYHNGIDVDVIKDEDGKPIAIEVWDGVDILEEIHLKTS